MANVEIGKIYLKEGISKKTGKPYKMLVTPVPYEGKIVDVCLNIQNNFERQVVQSNAFPYPTEAPKFEARG